VSSATNQYEQNIIEFGDTLSRFIEDETGYKELLEKISSRITKQDKVFIIHRGTREESDITHNISVDYIISFYLSSMLDYKQEREEINRLELNLLKALSESNLSVFVEDRGTYINEEPDRKIVNITLNFLFKR
jgi:putative N-acetylmannosamine-6-phosphate epimerase